MTKALAFLIAALFALPALAGDLPDPKLTPGALDPSVIDQSATLDVICHQSTSGRRHVTDAEKAQTFKAYGIAQEHRADCTGPSKPDKGILPACWEIDHLCSLELGCDNVAANRWPQRYDGQWGAHVKDKLENKLHALVCAGKVPLDQARRDISTDWIAAYQKYMPQ